MHTYDVLGSVLSAPLCAVSMSVTVLSITCHTVSVMAFDIGEL